MARISKSELERLKREVSLVRLIEAAGIELKKHGAADRVGHCPFHDDKTPSLVVSPKKNLWHCLGACQTGGGVIDWVMKFEKVSFTHAIERLRRELPLLAAPAAPHAPAASLEKIRAQRDGDQALLDEVIDYYHQTLLEGDEARAYLEKRGLVGDEVIKTFKLGYANRTLGYRLKSNRVKAGAAARGALQRIGLIRASGHEHFTGSLVVPIFDQDHVVEVYGRKITPNLRAGTPLHLYLPGPHKGLFNLEAVEQCQEIILCESLIDALTFWCAGFRNVTASYGVEGFTERHLLEFKENQVERVLIAYDRDEAGNKAAEKLAARLIGEGIETFRILFPKGMDANEYALKVQPAQKSLGLAIRQAEWLGKGKQPGIETVAAETLTVQETVEIAAARETPVAAPAPEPEPIPAPESSPLAAKAEEAAKENESPAAPPIASPVAAPPAVEIPADVREHEILLAFGDRRYRVRGLNKNLSYEVLKVNILVGCGDAFHVDTLDLYSAKHRSGYVRAAAVELGAKDDVIKHDLGKVLRKLEALQDELIQKTLEPEDKTVALSVQDEKEALELLRDPQLIERLIDDFAQCGVVGEATNLLVGYLACVSRQLEKPLAVLIQSTSAAGKSALMDAVLQMMPDEARVQYSAMTGQSLFYIGETDLKHKILAIAEEEGASQAAYALKLLQSEGVLTIASTGKDPQSGKLVTQKYRVEGPVMLFLTTTAIEIDEELLNRCLVLTVNESREQTRAIQAAQRARQTLSGLLAEADKTAVLTTHRNAQRLLKPLLVANPYAEQLTFLDAKTRTRRDHVKYLTLIRAIALLHQYQRETKRIEHRGDTLEYIEVTPSDIALANRLANEVLGRTLDELPPQTRRLLSWLNDYVTERTTALEINRQDYRFTRREIRTVSGWSDTQLRVHLGRLVALEYLLVHHGARGQSYVYELAYDGEGEAGQAFLPGLIDVTTLADPVTTSTSRGKKREFAGSTRPQRGVFAGPSRPVETAANAVTARAADDPPENPAETASQSKKTGAASYRNHNGAVASPTLAALEAS